MCGRIGQFSAWQSYVAALEAFRHAHAVIDDHRPRFNAGPGTRIGVAYPDGQMRPVWWGFRPHWAVARKIPQMINARGDKIESATWKPMLKAGRVIVPVDCWYEWIKADDGKKQPFLLRPKDLAPLYLAGLTNVKVEGDSGPRAPDDGGGMVDGVVIVTDASDEGMVDIHDRRPVALTAKDANLWLDPDTPFELAAEIARTGTRSVEEFEWYEVSRELNDARHDGPALIEPKE
ncbi:SOS response-associated peptidase [Robbsia sp. KACC 23696]|uniref:SOS response-associated peptidase n=1 Tax=Robbsia sp. KACC 23696 TaxID=3149231 RepID=UPI00325B0981